MSLPPPGASEDALRRQVAVLRRLLDAAPGWLALTDAEGRYLAVSSRYTDIWGIPVERIEGRLWHEVFPDLVPVHGPLIARCLAGETVPFDQDVPSGDGVLRIHGVYRPVTAPDGTVEAIILVALDITDRARAEEELRQARELLRVAIDAVPGWVALVDPRGRYVVANRMYAEAFGKSLDEIEGRPWWEVFPELVPVHKPLLDRCMAGETVEVQDVLALDRPTVVRGVYRPISGPDGALRFVSVLVMDVTAQARAEEALRQSEERLRLVTEAMDEAIGIRDGKTRKVLFANRAFEAMSGLSREEALRDPGAVFRVVAPHDRDRFRDWLEATVAAGTPGQIEYDAVRIDGGERRFWSRVKPVPAEDGSIRLWVTTTSDVTERWRAEQALAAEKERLSVTLASIADAVLAADTAGRVVLLNAVAERLTGWAAGEALGRPLSQVLRFTDRDWHTATGEPKGLQGRRVLGSLDGRATPVEGRTTPLVDAGGRVLGQVVVLRDVSDEVRREEERIQSQKLESLAVLAGGIAHDFNNLLTGIQGNLSLALSAPGLPEDIRGWLQDAAAAGDRSQGLTQQLLTFSRGGAPVRKVTDLRPVIRQAVTFAGLGSPVACRLEADPDLWPADADEGQVLQVVQNLVLNAVEATLPGGEVRVECANRDLAEGNSQGLPAGPWLCLRVLDRGSGIPEDIRARIFDPYFSTKKRRSGLGLAITHSIVVRHGGRIEVRSAPGQGTTFEVWLPASPGAPAAAGPGAREAAGGCGNVLVMDDDPFVRRVAQRALSRLGCSVVVTADGREAVEAYGNALREGQPFDVVLMDLTVPGGLGGVEAMAALREMDPGVRAIVMSGYQDGPVMADHALHGFTAVLPKPFTVERLREALEAARARGDRR